MEKKLIVSSSPHIKTNEDTSYIMKQVLIALIPATIASIWFFRISALICIISCIAGAVASEYLFNKLTKKKNTISDFSAVVTGLLLAFNVPASLPWWMCFIGGVFAIVVVKMVFGGIGNNFLNPALAARAFLLASFPVAMTAWTTTGVNFIGKNIDAVSTATPLSFLKAGPDGVAALIGSGVKLQDLIIGNVGGSLGETSAILLILGGVYLMYKGIINYAMPVVYIVTMFVLTFVLSGFNITFAVYELFSGGLMLGAFFMLTDYTTSPMGRKAQIVYACIAGVIATVIRMYGGYPEGVSYSILLANCLTPLLDKHIKGRIFGEVVK
ncbi:MAG: RnfABCDGE type electron transport complex subunit D [Clostridioides sp.]|jgi:electron transport complex protein RnfD|nr:RnfABCDGE type electron transport complex subunit D [Clostridioides sp.]